MTSCDMVIIEDSDFNYFWECSQCKTQHKDTAEFLKNETCLSCGATINIWIGVDDGYE